MTAGFPIQAWNDPRLGRLTGRGGRCAHKRKDQQLRAPGRNLSTLKADLCWRRGTVQNQVQPKREPLVLPASFVTYNTLSAIHIIPLMREMGPGEVR